MIASFLDPQGLSSLASVHLSLCSQVLGYHGFSAPKIKVGCEANAYYFAPFTPAALQLQNGSLFTLPFPVRRYRPSTSTVLIDHAFTD